MVHRSQFLRMCDWFSHFPHSTRVEIFKASVTHSSPFKHLPQPLGTLMQSFGTLGQLFKNAPPLSAQKSNSAGGWRSPWFVLGCGILIFCYTGRNTNTFPPKKRRVREDGVSSIFSLLWSPFKISEPYNNPFWKRRERREEKILPIIMATSLAVLAHTLHSEQYRHKYFSEITKYTNKWCPKKFIYFYMG